MWSGGSRGWVTFLTACLLSAARVSGRHAPLSARVAASAPASARRAHWPLSTLSQAGPSAPAAPGRRKGGEGAEAVGVVQPAVAVARGVVLGLQRFMEILLDKKDHLLAGAVARGVMIGSLYPVDTIKTRLQMYGRSNAMKGVDLGVLYGGLTASILGNLPYGCIVFGTYEAYKDVLYHKFPRLGHDAANLISAVLSDVTGSLFLCPSEIIKQQMQAGIGGGVSMASAVARTWRQQGPSGFFQGYNGQLLRDVPFRALQLPLYERTRELIERHMGHHRHTLGDSYEAWKDGVSGVVSGSISAALTTPCDVIKTRLMVDSSYRGFLDCGLKVARREGLRGLFSGVVPRTIYIGPSTGIFFICYGAVRNYLLAHPAFAAPTPAPPSQRR